MCSVYISNTITCILQYFAAAPVLNTNMIPPICQPSCFIYVACLICAMSGVSWIKWGELYSKDIVCVICLSQWRTYNYIKYDDDFDWSEMLMPNCLTLWCAIWDEIKPMDCGNVNYYVGVYIEIPIGIMLLSKCIVCNATEVNVCRGVNNMELQKKILPSLYRQRL